MIDDEAELMTPMGGLVADLRHRIAELQTNREMSNKLMYAHGKMMGWSAQCISVAYAMADRLVELSKCTGDCGCSDCSSNEALLRRWDDARLGLEKAEFDARIG